MWCIPCTNYVSSYQSAIWETLGITACQSPLPWAIVIIAKMVTSPRGFIMITKHKKLLQFLHTLWKTICTEYLASEKKINISFQITALQRPWLSMSTSKFRGVCWRPPTWPGPERPCRTCGSSSSPAWLGSRQDAWAKSPLEGRQKKRTEMF